MAQKAQYVASSGLSEYYKWKCPVCKTEQTVYRILAQDPGGYPCQECGVYVDLDFVGKPKSDWEIRNSQNECRRCSKHPYCSEGHSNPYQTGKPCFLPAQAHD